MKRNCFLRRHSTVIANEAEQQQLADELHQLDDDFYFIAHCNIGGEFMSDEAIARIQNIACYHWTRTLDDTAGISNEERVRKDRQPISTLPVQEPMLADKEEHIIYRDNKINVQNMTILKLKNRPSFITEEKFTISVFDAVRLPKKIAIRLMNILCRPL